MRWALYERSGKPLCIFANFIRLREIFHPSRICQGAKTGWKVPVGSKARLQASADKAQRRLSFQFSLLSSPVAVTCGHKLFNDMRHYSKQPRFLVAVDCIIFGYDGQELKLLVIQRGFKPRQGEWSLIGGFVQASETTEAAAKRVLRNLTGLDVLYLEQLHVFSEPERDTEERTVSVAYFALVDIKKYRQQLSEDYHPVWFPINRVPDLIFDHNEMVELARQKLRYKAALHPLLFELLPAKFTIPQLQNLYECVYNTTFDKGNFSRKILSTQLLTKLADKDKLHSKKGAFYYKVNMRKYNANFNSFMNLVANPHLLPGE